MITLGVTAASHDPAAAPGVGGEAMAAESQRSTGFTRLPAHGAPGRSVGTALHR